MLIEDAQDDDLPGMLEIVNDVIATSTAIFSESPLTLEEHGEWLAHRRENGFPVLVARDGDNVLAYATYGEFRHHAGYRTTVEHTILVAAGARRRGIGRALIMRLLEIAREDGRHVMVAGIDAANTASIAFHEEIGFVESARMTEIAKKWGQWLDLVLLTRRV